MKGGGCHKDTWARCSVSVIISSLKCDLHVSRTLRYVVDTDALGLEQESLTIVASSMVHERGIHLNCPNITYHVLCTSSINIMFGCKLL